MSTAGTQCLLLCYVSVDNNRMLKIFTLVWCLSGCQQQGQGVYFDVMLSGCQHQVQGVYFDVMFK